jgi:hypothetical protein
VSSGVSFMPVGLKIIIMGKIKGKDHNIIMILYYLYSRNIFTYRSVKQFLNQNKRRGVSDLKKVLNLPRILAQIIHYRNKGMSVKFEILHTPHLIQ